jgi:hypothetical protein
MSKCQPTCSLSIASRISHRLFGRFDEVVADILD